MANQAGLRRLLDRAAPRARDPRQVALRARRPGLRKLASAALAAGALAVALHTFAPAPPPTVEALALARDRPAGSVLSGADLRRVNVPPALLPRGAVDAGGAIGRRLAAPGRAGELLTTARLVGAGLLAGADPGQVAAPVRLADPAAAALLTPGDQVDVLLAAAGRRDAEVIVQAATVLAGPGAPTSDTGLLTGPQAGGGGLDGAGLGGAGLGGAGLGGAGLGGGLVLLVVSAPDAAALAGAAARGPLSVILRPPP